MTKNDFIKKGNKLYGDKYDYSLVEYKDYETPVKIICKKHGEFIRSPHSFLSKKRGCPICKKEENINNKKNKFIEKCKEIYGDNYDYSLVEYKGINDSIKIICKKHGIVNTTPKNFLRSGCPNCKTKTNKIKKPIKKEEFIKIKEKRDNNYFNELITFIKELGIKDYIIKENTILLIKHKIMFGVYDLHSHSEQQIKNKKYHLDKLLEYKNKGIRFIQIFEDEWVYKNEIVKNRIKHFLGKYEIKIGARQTKIKEISPKMKNEFLEKTHIQGVDRVSIKLGAFYGDILVGVMTFGKPRVALGRKTSLEGEFELSRFAVAPGYFVMGLGSKMFKYFVKNYNAKTIFTFSDKRWNIGTFYTNIGMEKVGETQVNYYYIINGERKHRFGFRKQELPKKLKKFDINLTEYENMLMNGIDRIWDCGSDKFIWHKNRL